MPPNPPRTKVLLAMSGGVDSSVAAVLLQDAGYDVVGCFMRQGAEDSLEADEATIDPVHCDPARPARPGKQGCCSVNDAADARLVAAMLGIPFYVMNFRKDFGRIKDYFVSEYNAGRTPNPCVRCNDWLKFGKLWEYARSIDATYVASGHHARVAPDPSGEPMLLRGADWAKDQSYVLFGASLERLRHTLLPIGGMSKQEVRRIAQDRGLPVFEKPDSQEICFVPDQDYMRLVRERTPEAVSEGDIVDASGRVVGRHGGHQQFTVGQRRGVGVALGYPLYVVGKDPEANTVTVGPRSDLAAGGLTADQTNWLVAPPTTPESARSCEVRVRYNGRGFAGRCWAPTAGELEVRFDQPVNAVSPGQAVVCYDGDRVLGGGWIRDVLPAL